LAPVATRIAWISTVIAKEIDFSHVRESGKPIPLPRIRLNSGQSFCIRCVNIITQCSPGLDGVKALKTHFDGEHKSGYVARTYWVKHASNLVI
jgi:hypothetical protein